MKTVNVYDVAKAAKVSPITVSRVVNNKGNVADKTKEKVLEAIKELNYQPNAIAQSLVNKKTNIIGIVIYSENKSYPGFYNEILVGIREMASKRGYDVLIFSNNAENSYARRIVGSRLVDGVILMGVQFNKEDVAFLEKNSFPYIAIGRRKCIETTPFYISPDYTEAMREATAYLLELGHKEIAFLGTVEEIEADYDKMLGYYQAYEDKKIPVNPDILMKNCKEQEEGYDMTYQLLKNNKSITAIIAGNTYTTIGSILAVKALGLRIPEDVSIIGFDDNDMLNNQFAPIIGLEISCLKLKKHALGEMASCLLIDMFNTQTVGKKNYISLEFIKKDSCTQAIT